jgi:ribosome-associated protein
LETQEIINLVISALEDVKGQHIETFDVCDLTAVTDCMVICTGTSSTHLKALADEVVVKAKEAGLSVNGVEGRIQAEWVLVDLGPVIVHLMLSATRALYRLEDLWDFNAPVADRSMPRDKGEN